MSKKKNKIVEYVVLINYFNRVRGIILIACLTAVTDVSSHGGRTNSEGCHNNRKTGGYHCHNSGSKSKPKATRKAQSKSSVRSLLNSSNKKFTCSGKTVCKEMVNCAEARFYLKECKLYRLDRDDDGIPCESICGGKRQTKNSN